MCKEVPTGPLEGGTSVCTGAAGHDGESGGTAGAGGLYIFSHPTIGWVPYLNMYPARAGEVRAGGVAARGVDGVSASAPAGITSDGYQPANGSAGSDGAPGKGGSGGSGGAPVTNNPPPEVGRAPRWYGASVTGGGAGGCPGLAGTPGAGGGASIAVVVTGAPLKLDGSALFARNGGAGGRGSLGSSPTSGGNAGNPAFGNGSSGRAGGAGGAAGVSGSGAGGASYGLAYAGQAPIIIKTTAAAGRGGDGVAEISSADALGNAKTIPASASGVAQGIHQP